MEYVDKRGVKYVPGEQQWTDREPTSAASAGPMPAVGGQTYRDWHDAYYASTRAAQNHAAGGWADVAKEALGTARAHRESGNRGAAVRAQQYAADARRAAVAYNNDTDARLPRGGPVQDVRHLSIGDPVNVVQDRRRYNMRVTHIYDPDVIVGRREHQVLTQSVHPETPGPQAWLLGNSDLARYGVEHGHVIPNASTLADRHPVLRGGRGE